MERANELDENVITIDGPAGSGKSTVARLLAQRLGYRFLDTGAMYRAVALAALDAGVAMEPLDADAAVRALDEARMSLAADGTVLLAGVAVDDRIRTDAVTRVVSRVSSVPAVRERLTRLQREFGSRARPGVVAEGRDMATVVFPRARHRFYLDAAIETRARRRRDEMLARGLPAPDLAEAVRLLRERDAFDSGRKVAPLRVGEGVTRIDTTPLDVRQVVDELERRVMSEAVG